VDQVLSGLILVRMSSQKVWWIVAGVLTLSVVWMLMSRTDYSGLFGSPTPSASASATPGVGGTKTPTPAQLTYMQAVERYANTRIQFDQYCQGKPSSMSLKTGTSIMLDNRSGDARTIAVDGVKYQLAGYGFRIITLTSKTLPHTVKIDCGSARNVAQVLLQASIGQ